MSSVSAVDLPPTRAKAAYRPDLDGLRAIAVILVILM